MHAATSTNGNNDTLPKLLRFNAAHWPNAIAVRAKDFGLWQEFTWADCLKEVREIAAGLTVLGVTRGGVVGIIGENRPEWLWSEFAAHAIGAMSLGIYQDSMNDEISYLIDYASASVVIAEDEEQVVKLLQIAETAKSIKHIIYDDPRGMRKYDDARLLSLKALKEKGREALSRDPGLFDRMVDAGNADEVAVLCTTSGTTSRPKLVMLQAGPFIEHILRYLEIDERQPRDNYVSVLPLPWIMEQVYCVVQHLAARVTVNFVEEPETMMADLREIGPAHVLLAPRVWESIAADIRARMMDSTWLKQKLFDFGFALGKRAVEKGRRSGLADVLVFRALRDRLGFSNLKSAITGGAALGPDTFRLFQIMGLPMRQIYGQTELAGAYTTHKLSDVDYGTVGVEFFGTDIRIDNPDAIGVGEIVARTPGTFLGYYKDARTTSEVLKEGWFHTGDAGYFKVENSQLVVIDRISDLATTTAGARFSPQFIENNLKFSPFIGEAVILGHERDFLTAILCIRYSIVSKWAEQRRIAFTNYTDLASRTEVYALIRAEVEEVNSRLPEAHRVERFVLLYKELDADDGELTRTRKVRRNVINERYNDLIGAIYEGHSSVPVDTELTFQDGSKTRIKTDLVIASLRHRVSHVLQAAE